jgi:SagB-type dehydrogenase family enzyme
MSNWDNNIARQYHEATKHRPGQLSQNRVDPRIIPRPYKLYRDLETVALPPPAPSTLTALEAIGGASARPEASLRNLPNWDPTLATLSALLHHSAGVIRRSEIRGRKIEFRAAPCTGALYHIELYLAVAGLPGLPAGVYHYGVQEEGLIRLRAGDYRQAISEAVCGAPEFQAPAAVVVLTSCFWRNTWRYEDRAYRHVFWDAGTILANLLGLAAGHGLAASVAAGFRDQTIEALIGVDGRHEGVVALVALGERASPPTARTVEAIDPPVIPASPVEIEYGYLLRLHDDSKLADCEDVARWRTPAAVPPEPSGPSGPPINWDSTFSGPGPRESVEDVIARRGSARRFSRSPVTQGHLAVMLDGIFRPIEADFAGSWPPLTDAFLIINAVEGVAAGAYRYDAANRKLELLREGDFREQAKFLALDQSLAGDAALNIYFLSQLGPLLSAFGARGYRAAELEAGIRGGRAYLAAYALGLKATGLTFYDDEVIEFFGEAAEGYDVMFLVAIGH